MIILNSAKLFEIKPECAWITEKAFTFKSTFSKKTNVVNRAVSPTHNFNAIRSIEYLLPFSKVERQIFFCLCISLLWKFYPVDKKYLMIISIKGALKVKYWRNKGKLLVLLFLLLSCPINMRLIIKIIIWNPMFHGYMTENIP